MVSPVRIALDVWAPFNSSSSSRQARGTRPQGRQNKERGQAHLTKSLPSLLMSAQQAFWKSSLSVRMDRSTAERAGLYMLRLSLKGSLPVSSWWAITPAAHMSDLGDQLLDRVSGARNLRSTCATCRCTRSSKRGQLTSKVLLQQAG